jgi:formate dehydrogenase subunit gamma
MSADAQPQILEKVAPLAPARPVAQERPDYYVRFNLATRVEHFAMMVVFTLLVITGLPQKYATAEWAQSFAASIGGVGAMRYVHRILGWIFTIQMVLHIAGLLAYVLRRKGPLTMVPNRRDFTDAIGTLKYYLGMKAHHPPYDRYDYKQKFEYWGMLMGSVLMVVTGFILLYPIQIAAWFPGQTIPVAKVAHSNEGLMALLVIVVWHIYNALLCPDVFPADTSIFTGKISRERMEKEHSLELERLEGKSPGEGHDG